jgi:hypothetical protein
MRAPAEVVSRLPALASLASRRACPSGLVSGRPERAAAAGPDGAVGNRRSGRIGDVARYSDAVTSGEHERYWVWAPGLVAKREAQFPLASREHLPGSPRKSG